MRIFVLAVKHMQKRWYSPPRQLSIQTGAFGRHQDNCSRDLRWGCHPGVGRCRFMLRGASPKAPKKLISRIFGLFPSWLVAKFINRFLVRPLRFVTGPDAHHRQAEINSRILTRTWGCNANLGVQAPAI